VVEETVLELPVSANPLTGTADPCIRVRLPEDDLFGVDASTLRFTADGWAPLIEPLRPGHHVISVRSAGSDPGRPSFDDYGTLQLEVRGRR
jgi:hypothetical protein